MWYITVIFLLLNIGVGHTTQEQHRYQQSYTTTGTIPDAHLVQDDPRFPQNLSTPTAPPIVQSQPTPTVPPVAQGCTKNCQPTTPSYARRGK